VKIDGRALALTGAVALLTVGSYLRNVPCLVAGSTGTSPTTPRCPSDLEVMWLGRGLAEGAVPYLQPIVDPQTGQLVTVEYPVLTGMLMWLLSRGGSLASFLALSTLVMGLAAVAIALILNRWCGSRAWLWAAAPALLHYLSYNYDALPTLAVVGALALVLGRDAVRVEGRYYLSAAAILGVGGGLKLFPLLFALPLALWLLFGRPGPDQLPLRARAGRAMAAAGVAAGVFIAVNLPFALANPQGWLIPFTFQANRAIDATSLSLWYFASALWPSVAPSVWLLLAGGATLVGIGGAAAAGWALGRRRGSYPLVPACVTVLIAYMLLNKVFSPQYILWLLPLLVLAGLRARIILAYLVIDVVMFWSIAAVLHTRELGLNDAMGVWTGVLLLSTLSRLVYLAWVAGVPFRREGRSAAPRGRSAASG
jgi:uncharacterized membrane protein